MENALTLRCHSCGAGVASDWPNCRHCGVRLATVACPTCFGMMFLGSKFCGHCGAVAVKWEADPATQKCPSCRGAMLHGTIGPTSVHECRRCFGLWLDKTSFDVVCRDQERQASVLASRSLDSAGDAEAASEIRYRRCMVCSDLMHRTNYARCSGVIIDTCAKHGVWFDRNELRHIVEFIQKGGLTRSREREVEELEARARRAESSGSAPFSGMAAPETTFSSEAALPTALEIGGEILGAILSSMD